MIGGRAWGAREVVEAVNVQSKALHEEARWYDEQIQQHHDDLQAVQRGNEEAWQHLAAVIVPDLDAARLDRVAATVGLPAIGRDAVAAGMQYEHDRMHRRIAEVEANPEYVDREGILLECERQIAEYDEMIAPFTADVTSIHADPVWHRLRDAGYGTGSYAAKWYQLSYYRDWKEGDLLVERHGPRLGVTTWAALRDRAIAAEAAVATLRAERETHVARRSLVDSLVRERAACEQALGSLPARQLAAVHGRLRGHLEHVEIDRIAAMFPGDHAVMVALQRLSGLAAKQRYLGEAARQYLFEPREAVYAALTRNNRDRAKLSRPKSAGRTFPAETMERRFRDRSGSLGKRRQRWEETRTHVVGFDDYDRGSLARDFLWWDVMTDGRLDGDFIPEVHDHNARHPGDRHAQAVAAVAEAPTRDDLLLMGDGS